MAKSNVKEKVQALLALARQLVQMPGLTWVEASNAVYAPGGPFVRLFPTKADRVAYSKTKESKQIDDLIHSLPTPPTRPGVEILDSKFMIPIPESSSRRAGPRKNGRARVSPSARTAK